MSKINALCVYCGSSPGTDPAFVETAQNFGKILAENEIRLVYGGGSTGLMGALASAVLDHGGEVTGIIPEFLTQRERPRRLPQELIVTTDMHDRKWRMFERGFGERAHQTGRAATVDQPDVVFGEDFTEATRHLDKGRIGPRARSAIDAQRIDIAH